MISNTLIWKIGMNIKKGQIFLAALDPAVGSEIQKTRPVIIVSNNINNKYNSVVTIVPITSNVTKIFPFEVFIKKGVAGLPKDSKGKADQIRTLDITRLIKVLGNLPVDIVAQLDAAIKIHLALD
jgi:mRNA interferase MazF